MLALCRELGCAMTPGPQGTVRATLPL
jgi:hypothetical protein